MRVFVTGLVSKRCVLVSTSLGISETTYALPHPREKKLDQHVAKRFYATSSGNR